MFLESRRTKYTWLKYRLKCDLRIVEKSKDQMYNIDVQSLNHSVNFTSKYELKMAGRRTKCNIL